MDRRDEACPPELGFEVVASFLGGRNYNRFEIEEATGQALAAVTGLAFRDSRERESPPDLSFRVHPDHQDGLLGLRVAAAPLHRRHYRAATVPGSLHPPVAFGLCMLAGLRPGHLVVDPFCGAGTIPIEARFAAQDLRVVATDIDSLAVSATADKRPARSAAASGRIATASGTRSRGSWRRTERRSCSGSVGRTRSPSAPPAWPGASPVRLSLSGRWTDVSVLSAENPGGTDPGC